MGRSNPVLMRRSLPLYTHTCEMCRSSIEFHCETASKCHSWGDISAKIKKRTQLFLALLVLTLACFSLIIAGCILASNEYSSDPNKRFTFVLVVVCTSILFVLFLILVYIWITDYFYMEYQFISKIDNAKRK